MKELIIKVEGMVCNGCEKRVQNALEQLKEVEKVVANYRTGTVSVTLKQEINEEMIKEKIEDIGFKVR